MATDVFNPYPHRFRTTAHPHFFLPSMTSIALLTGSHLRTYTTIFQHPVSHNLEWRDVHALFRQLGHVEEEPNGNLKVTRNGQTIVLHPPRTKDVAETDELMKLRHFLERSQTAPAATQDRDLHWLLVIDRHEARIYRSEMKGAVPQQILPHQPENNLRHTPDAKSFSRGEKPEPNRFFEPVTKALNGTGPVLVFGSGTGKSSEMDQFVAWVKIHHPLLAKRIIGTQVIDQHHLSGDQILAKAREFYASNPAV
jgi:hypothetical protein